MSRLEQSLVGAAVLLAVVGILVGSLTSEAALAGGLIALAPVIVIAYQSIYTRRAVDASTSEAEAARQQVEESRQDRELGVRPVLVRIGDHEPAIDVSTSTATTHPLVHIRNIGRGPALRVRVFRGFADWVFFSQRSVSLAAGEETDSDPDAIVIGGLETFLELSGSRGPGHSVPAEIVSAAEPSTELVAYCVDQLGNRLRFNLRTEDPPRTSPRDDAEPPRWLEAWNY